MRKTRKTRKTKKTRKTRKTRDVPARYQVRDAHPCFFFAGALMYSRTATIRSTLVSIIPATVNVSAVHAGNLTSMASIPFRW
jgi:hypothetical protein